MTDEELLELVRKGQHTDRALDELANSRQRISRLGQMTLKEAARADKLAEAVDAALYLIIHADDVSEAVKILRGAAPEWKPQPGDTKRLIDLPLSTLTGYKGQKWSLGPLVEQGLELSCEDVGLFNEKLYVPPDTIAEWDGEKWVLLISRNEK